MLIAAGLLITTVLPAEYGIDPTGVGRALGLARMGEIKVSLLNTDASQAYDVAVGDRIAQLIIMPVPRVRFVAVDELPDSARGEGGFGSTGYQTGTNS